MYLVICKKGSVTLPALLAILLIASPEAHAQAQLEPWGNFSGIRVEGQLMKFESAISMEHTDPAHTVATKKEAQTPSYTRTGTTRSVNTVLDSVDIKEEATDLPDNLVSLSITGSARANRKMEGLFFTLPLLPGSYVSGTATVSGSKKLTILSLESGAGLKVNSLTLNFSSPSRQLRLVFKEPTSIRFKNTPLTNNVPVLYIPVLAGNIAKGQTFAKTFTLHMSGSIDKAAVTLKLDTAQGRAFIGFGGNFRLQNPKTDPQVIDYCLNNLRVAYSRVEMPFVYWQPVMDSDPVSLAQDGKLDKKVEHAMEMAARLGEKHIPVILTAWSAPDWAIEGKRTRHVPGGIWGNPLDRNNIAHTYKSIADYIIYLRDHYKTEVAFFSFNESDLGINIRQTGQQHDELIKGLGAYFVTRGLHTKMLLGDNSDANTWSFIKEALNDPAARPYIGAVSFHSWRGWEKETLQHWADAASQLKLPLLVGEGSIDAQASGYPQIFKEPVYALEEINLYVRLLAIVQPLSILQWQFTADYSPLTGGGIFGDNGPLLPTQRFFNMKQLAASPENVFAMAVEADRPGISAAGLGNNAAGIYTFHLVNNGAERQTTLTGFPEGLRTVKVFITDKDHHMDERSALIQNGAIRMLLPADSFVSVNISR